MASIILGNMPMIDERKACMSKPGKSEPGICMPMLIMGSEIGGGDGLGDGGGGGGGGGGEGEGGGGDGEGEVIGGGGGSGGGGGGMVSIPTVGAVVDPTVIPSVWES